MALKPYSGDFDPIESPGATVPVANVKPYTGDFNPLPAKAAPLVAKRPQRTWTEAATDTARGLASGVGSVVKGVGTIGGLATGNMDNSVTRLGDSVQEHWQGGQSDALKFDKAQRSDAIDAADGIVGKAGTAIWETITNPALLVDTVAETAASMIPAGIIGKAGAVVSGTRALSQGATAAQAATRAVKVGTAAGIGTGAVQAGADVAGGTYDDSMASDDAALASNPEYVARVAAGESPEAVKHALALSASRTAFAAAVPLSVATQFIPGGSTIERAVAGAAAKAGSRSGLAARGINAVKGVVGEGLQETLEEGGGQFVGNLAQQAYVDPNTNLAEGVGESAGLGFVGGAGLGGVAGAAQRPTAQTAGARAAGRPQPVVQPAGAITRAADPSVQEVAVPPPVYADARPGSLSDAANAVSAARPRANDAGWRAQLAAAQADELVTMPIQAPGPQLAEGSVPQAFDIPAPPNVPWINADTGEFNEPSDTDIEGFIHEQFNQQMANGHGVNVDVIRKALTNSGLPTRRRNPLITKVQGDRKRGITGIVAEGVQSELEQDRAELDSAVAQSATSKAAQPIAQQESLLPTAAQAPDQDLGTAPQAELASAPPLAATPAQSPQREQSAPPLEPVSEDGSVRESAAAPTSPTAAPSPALQDQAVASSPEVPSTADSFDAPQPDAPVSPPGSAQAPASAAPAAAAPLSEQGPRPLESGPLVAADQGAVPSAQATPATTTVQAAAAQAATSPDNDQPTPSDAQLAAGNFRVGRMKIAGLDVSIEHPAGSVRKEGHVPMSRAYGYFRRSEAKDGDKVDVFLGDRAGDPALPVFVIDQVDKDGKYDEAKVVMGEADEASARKAYLDSYPKGWTGLGAITQMTQDEFKAWVKDPAKTKKPAAIGKQSLQVATHAAPAPRVPAAAPVQGKVIMRGGRPQYSVSARETLEAYFQPGRVVDGYGGTDEVVAFDWNDGAWQVQVRAKTFNGKSVDGEAPRWHHTSPSSSELAKVLGKPVGKASRAKAAATASPASTPAAPAAVTAKAPAAPAEAPIVDLGEKIGGARKDLSGGRSKPKKAEPPRYEAVATRDGKSWVVQDAKTKKRVVSPSGYTASLYPTEDAATTAATALNQARDKAKASDSTWRKRYAVVDNSTGEIGRKPWAVRDMRTGRMMRGSEAATEAEAEALIPLLVVSLNHRARPMDDGKFEIWRAVTDRKRVKVVKQTFDSRDDAMRYMAENAAAIIETKTRFGEDVLAKPDTVNRKGPERRTGPVAGQDFMDTFGFRGVEFGNWNNQVDRQEVMNHAFDGLLDLADLLGIPPAAISLEGDLALAFGARGQGLTGARAHYEPKRGVINLTKMSGAGALAHEWFHALDHYFGRQDRKKPDRTVGADGTSTFETEAMLSQGNIAASGVRPELLEKYRELVQGMFTKAEQYVEDTARAQKFAGATQEALAGSLQKIRDHLAKNRTYGAKTKAATEEQLAEFDALADTLMTTPQTFEFKPTKAPAHSKFPSGAGRQTNDTLEAMSAILRAVTGRAGFNADKAGDLDMVRGHVKRHGERVAMLASAERQDTKTKRVPTAFAMDAKAIDQGSVNPGTGTLMGLQLPASRSQNRGSGQNVLSREDVVNAAAEGGSGLMSKAVGKKAAGGLSFDRAQQLKTELTAKWGDNAPNVVLIEDAEGFPASAKIDSDYRRGEGFYSGRSTVWINVGRIKTEQRFAEVLAHEALGHYGVEGVVGKKQWAGIVDAIAKLDQDKTGSDRVRRILAEVHEKQPGLSRDNFAREAIAFMAEKGIRNTFTGRVIAAVRRYLRQIMPTMQWSENDVRGLFSQADGFLHRGRTAPQRARVVQSYSFSLAEPIVSGAFKRWFRQGKTVDASGAPKVVYHGTSEDFWIFEEKSGAATGHSTSPFGFFFTGNKALAQSYAENASQGVPADERVVDAYLSIQNPYAMTLAEAQAVDSPEEARSIRAWLERQGHDGIHIAEADNWIAFRAEQVKSASENSGAFDPGNGDMRFSKTAAGSADGEHTAGPDPSRPFAPTLDLDSLQFDKRPLSYAIKGGLSWLKEKAWLPLMPANYLLDYVRPGQVQPARFMAIKDLMDSMRGELHGETNEHSQKWLDYHIENRKESAEVAAQMHESTLDGTDPSEDYSPLQFRYGGKNWTATAENVRNALKAIKDQSLGRAGDKKGAMYDERDAIKAMGEAEKARPAKHKALQQRFNKLSEAGKELFTSTRDEYKKRDELLDATLMRSIEKEMENAVTRADRTHAKLLQSFTDQGLTGDELATSKKRAETKHLKDKSISRQKKAARLKEMREAMESKRLQGPYFPITRYGNYFVTIRDAVGKVLSFSKFENAGDQQWYADQVKTHVPGVKVETGMMSNKDQVRGAVDAGYVADIEEMLDGMGASSEMLDAVWQRYLESLPDFSIRKQFIHRKGTDGYQQDALRSFGKTMFHSAHQLAKLEHGSDLAATVDLMREEAKEMDDPTQAGMLANEFEHRLKWVMNPTGSSGAQKLTGFAFVWNLAASPAAALVNWTQTPMLGVPILGARFGGMTKAGAALLKASAQLVKSKDWHLENSLTGQEKTAMEAFFSAGLLDRTFSHAVAGIGDSGVEYSAVRERVMQKMSFMFHHMERINRETTALAAYRMARDSGMAHEAAITEAMRLTKKIHFDMSNSSRSRALTSDFAKVAMTHRAYSLNMAIRMLRDVHQMFKGETPEARLEARRQFVGIMGMHALLAGVMGVPFYGIAMMTAGFLKDAFGDDDDDRTPEDILKSWFYDAMPKELADTVLYGAPSTATGLSIYNRIGFPDLFFRSAGREMEGRSEAEYWINQVLGPVFGLGAQIWDGLNLIRKGEVQRGVEKMVPKSLRDPLKSTRYIREGVLTFNGDPIVDELNAWEMIGQAAGFAPFIVSEAYEQRGAKMNLQTSIQRRKSQAMNMYALGYRQQDTEIMQAAMEEVRNFNRAYPEAAIDASSIRTSLRQRAARAARNQTGGVVIERRLEGRIERALGY